MLDYIFSETQHFLETIPKTQRKKKGQFFTSKETAMFMASLFSLDNFSTTDITILDPGAGTGILSAAIIDRIYSDTHVNSVHLTCYENDETVLPVLRNNLEYIKENSPISFKYDIIDKNYITTQADSFEGNSSLFQNQHDLNNLSKYDIVIGNPPYLKIARNDPAALGMSSIVHGAPNMYFLFTAMSLFNLKDNGEMVYIIPRSWTSGEYFRSFRKYILENSNITHIHLFVSRDKVFSQEKVLQETMIVKLKKEITEPKSILITSTNSNNDFKNISQVNVPYNSVITGKKSYVFLPTSEKEVQIIQTINQYINTLPDEGLKMHTGIVVDYRQHQSLRATEEEHTVPLFYSQHIKQGRVNHLSSGKKYDWIIDSNPSLLQANQNYVFCKRFTAKEEHRRLQCGIYLSKDFPNYKLIATQNKINFISRTDGKAMDEILVYGIYALLNSTLFDMFYRILNGSTQVNSSEINSIPVPPIKHIQRIGQLLLDTDDLSTFNCDKILREVSYNE